MMDWPEDAFKFSLEPDSEDPDSKDYLVRGSKTFYQWLMVQTAACIIQACRDMEHGQPFRGLMEIVVNRSSIGRDSLTTPLGMQAAFLYAFVKAQVEGGTPFDYIAVLNAKEDKRLITQALEVYEEQERSVIESLNEKSRDFLMPRRFKWSQLNQQFLDLG